MTDESADDRQDEDEAPRLWPWFLGGLVVLALGGAGYWAIAQTPETEAQPAPPPPLLETAEVEVLSQVVIRQTAFVRPVAELAVLPETTARIAEVLPDFDRGRRVAQGTVLVRLDTTALDAEVARAQAALGEAEAAVTEARIEADRQETLEARGVAAEAVLQQALVGLASAEAGLESARVAVRLARDARQDSEVIAPFDAVVTEVTADPGALVGPQTTLGQLVSAEAVELEVGLLPRDLALLPGGAATLPGARMDLRETADGPVLAKGVVASVERGLATGSRLLPVVVRVPDPFEGERPLRLGELLLAELPVEVEGGGALSVPERAMKPGGVVWAVRDGALVRLEPTLLIRQDGPEGTRAVLRAGGLEAGDRVMLTDLPGASEGQEVRTGDGETKEGGT